MEPMEEKTPEPTQEGQKGPYRQSISGNIRLTDPNNNSNTISLDVINGAISGNSLSLTVRDNTGSLPDMSGSLLVSGNNLTGSLNGSFSNGCRLQLTFNFTKR